MTISESVLVAAFTMLVVFAVLAILYAIICLFSVAIPAFSKKEKKPVSSTAPITEAQVIKSAPQIESETFSSGTLKLINVDEPTAAMIMAIVSDESGIPLSELCFKSIRLISE